MFVNYKRDMGEFFESTQLENIFILNGRKNIFILISSNLTREKNGILFLEKTFFLPVIH
jgi:hypothetical protein